MVLEKLSTKIFEYNCTNLRWVFTASTLSIEIEKNTPEITKNIINKLIDNNFENSLKFINTYLFQNYYWL